MALPDFVLVFSIATMTAALAVWWISGSQTIATNTMFPEPESLALLFQDGVLHHGTDTALARFALQPGTHVWDDIRNSLLPRFPEFPDRAGAGQLGSITLQATDKITPDEIRIRWRGPVCWVTFGQCVMPDGARVDPANLDELENLQRANITAPHPVWQQDASGSVCWYNEAYARLFEIAHGQSVNPQKPLFEQAEGDDKNRVSLRIKPNEKPDWYELSIATQDDLTICHATGINAVVDAEEARRNFVQTLTKTFAHLSIGLAIFDRNGQLKLFNPALVDLTGLPAQFLSARPTLLSFFDQLRENRRMPEPKNYLSWRQEIADVIAAATDGRYQETWPLETGQTYSVKGRPHPDGATAFLIEDISAEVALTRNFRAELELGQSLLDTVDDGLAVFSANSTLTYCNAAYRSLWKQNPDSAFADTTLTDSIAVWKTQSSDDLLWKRVENFVGGQGKREPWGALTNLNDGTSLMCRLSPIAAGAVLVRFCVVECSKTSAVSADAADSV